MFEFKRIVSLRLCVSMRTLRRFLHLVAVCVYASFLLLINIDTFRFFFFFFLTESNRQCPPYLFDKAARRCLVNPDGKSGTKPNPFLIPAVRLAHLVM